MKDFEKDTESEDGWLEANSVEEAIQKLNIKKCKAVSGSVRIHEYSLFHFEAVNVDHLIETLTNIQKISGEKLENSGSI